MQDKINTLVSSLVEEYLSRQEVQDELRREFEKNWPQILGKAFQDAMYNKAQEMANKPAENFYSQKQPLYQPYQQPTPFTTPPAHQFQPPPPPNFKYQIWSGSATNELPPFGLWRGDRMQYPQQSPDMFQLTNPMVKDLNKIDPSAVVLVELLEKKSLVFSGYSVPSEQILFRPKNDFLSWSFSLCFVKGATIWLANLLDGSIVVMGEKSLEEFVNEVTSRLPV